MKTEELEIEIDKLKPHPRNYRTHPDDQLKHIIESIKKYGIYRKIVVVKDDTILAGHGVVQAAKEMGLKKIPIFRLNISPNSTEALKLLVGDNEISNLVMPDDIGLTDLLKEIKDSVGLIGTGYDDMMLANLLMATRSESEIKDFDAAAHWVDMPEFESGSVPFRIIFKFKNKRDRNQFIKENSIPISPENERSMLDLWWPDREKNNRQSIRFEK